MRYRFARFFLLLGTAVLLAACSQIPVRNSDSTSAAVPALGTQWGEERDSRVVTVRARRVAPDRPDDVAQLFYNDADGVRAKVGASPERQLNTLMAQGHVEWSVRDEADRPLPLERARRGPDGALNIVGRQGARYVLVFNNLSDDAYEVVATVDGLDVLNGQSGSITNSGYVLYPHGTLRIEGFRKSDSEVAAFRFSAADRAYAANTPSGDARNIGVIGAALFRLEMPDSQRTLRNGPAVSRPKAFPADGNRSYAPPPDYRK
ncbi:MAG: hypothetical protein LBE78_11435 [Burkholderiaceae bacterium]|jgi:hypothetical protein|nr:hypothetical protein [Burkholderiaceae bacterium]